MKRVYINELLFSLRNIDLSAIEDKADQYAVIDNVIALSEEAEALEKAQREAVTKFKPANFDSLQGEEKEKAHTLLNSKLNDFLTPRLEEEVKIKLKKLSAKSVESIFNQKKDLTTAQKASIVRFLK
ncbi:MAG TPA: hypothetical protein GX717_07355 [Clostridiaceae bacterium]|nr:hypothetical protein [Clostridiaceae bacterium]